ncbi:MAG TPA: YiiD C-terminal domain-containing protein [Syntrophales bacterium]|nr:YiiD C-terminal domain-containing protein [Syntrophales bacterium]
MAISESRKETVAALENIIKIVGKMGVKIERFDPGDVKVRLPKEPNINHVGMVYAGSLFSLADFTGGVLFSSCFDLMKYIPILKEASIVYRRPAMTDMTIETSFTQAEIDELRKTADSVGKADFVKEFELKDESGTVCCMARGSFQIRKAG